jgi:DNA-binding NtrC family response regulator
MKKILIIDDEAEIRNIFKEILEEEGFSVSTAMNGDKGMECLKQDQFDVIILDKKMPFRSGPDFVREAKPLLGNAKILLVSGSPSIDNCEVAGFLPKPCSIDLLVDTVKKLTA